MIFSKNENRNNWRFGEIFLKKYFFTFNHESKKIGFYIKSTNKTKDEDIKNKEKIKINYYIILFFIDIILLIIEFGFCIYSCHNKYFRYNRKKRANELIDDNYDYQSIN